MSRAPEPPRPGTSRSFAAGTDRSGGGERSGPPSLSLGGDDFALRTEAQRRALTGRLEAWSHSVAGRLAAAGVDAAPRIADAAFEPRAVFGADGSVILVLSVGSGGVRAGLELPPSSARAVRAALMNPETALEVDTALGALPEQFELAVEGDAHPAQAPRCGVDDLRSQLDRIERDRRPLWIGWTVSREVALQHSTLLDEQLTDALVLLGRLLTLLVGVDEDGRAAARADRSGARRKRGVRRGEEDRDRERRPRAGSQGGEARGHRASHGAESPAERAHDPSTGLSSSEHSAEGAREGAGEARSDGPGLDARSFVRSRLGARLRIKAHSAGAAGHEVVEKGAEVRVLEGPFAGKVGVVQELDGKGGARVMMGLLAVRIDTANLEVHVERRRRPVLSTSHRKPVPVRS